MDKGVIYQVGPGVVLVALVLFAAVPFPGAVGQAFRTFGGILGAVALFAWGGPLLLAVAAICWFVVFALMHWWRNLADGRQQ